MTICDSMLPQLGAMFMCQQKGKYLRIRTPFMYPNGDYVDLFLDGSVDDGALTDFGETLGWLRLQGGALKRSPRQESIIEDVCRTLGVEVSCGAIIARPRAFVDFATAIMTLGQACVRVADIWYTFRFRVGESIHDDVGDFLTEQQVPFERNVPFVGISSTEWKVDFDVKTERRRTLVQVLSTGSKSMTRRLAEKTVALWTDLRNVSDSGNIACVSLFDDTSDIWAQNEIQLVENVSQIALWASPRSFLDAIGANAA